MIRTCTRCRKPYEAADPLVANAAPSYAPFCSKRCADVDLVHWLKGDYVIDGSGGLSLADEDEAPQTVTAPRAVDDEDL